MSMTLQQTLETYRPEFESRILKILQTTITYPLARDSKGQYIHQQTEAAWWGYCAGLQHEWRNGQNEYHDRKRLDWLETQHTLHGAVEFLYVVDGYQCALTHDGNKVCEAHGDTLRLALDAVKNRADGK